MKMTIGTESYLRNSYVHRNQQYSILALTDSSGAVVERVAYQAYGQPTFTNAVETTLSPSAKATRYWYTGREWDSSLELHHFRARWMSGVNGRFLGRDPIGFEGSEWNLYEYVNSTPESFVDSLGLQKCRAELQKGGTAPQGKDIDPSAPLQSNRGRYRGSIAWKAEDGGVTLGSEINYRGRKLNGVVRATSTISVSCECVECECKAAPLVLGLGQIGAGKGKIGDPIPKPFEADGKTGTQDRFFVHSLLGGFAAGDSITVWGNAGWDYTARKWTASSGRIYLDDEKTRNSKKVSFTWKCVGTCPLPTARK